MEESAILAEIFAGDTEKFGLLYDAYFARIYNYLSYRTRAKELAEDLTSETFFKAIRAISSFDSNKGGFSTWIYRIARNTLYDHFRAHPGGRAAPIEQAEALIGPDDVERSTVDRELVKKINDCVAKLPLAQQEIITMRLWDDLPYAEIALVLGKSEGSCKMEFSRGMKKLREMTPLAALLLLIAIATK